MTKINSKIFREYDIRGIVGEDLSDDFAYILGRAYAEYLQVRGAKSVVAGRDTRATSESYQNALMRGLAEGGCEVRDMGIAIVSAIYFAREHWNIDAGVVVTASHNPPKYNGFKLCRGANSVSGDEMQEVRRITEKIAEKIAGQNQPSDIAVGKIILFPEANKIYYDEIKKRISLKKKLKVVVDSGAAIAGIFVPKLLRELGCEVIELYSEVNPNNPPHPIDPTVMSAYGELVKTVLENKTDVGVMFDGDADRVGFVDEKGEAHIGDTILTFLARDYLPKNPGAKVIVEVSNSEMVAEEVLKLGGIPVWSKKGRTFINKKIQEEGALLSGETSCHYTITKDWYDFDDAIYAMCQVLRILSENAKTFSEIIDNFPKYYSTLMYRIGVKEDEKFNLVKNIAARFRPFCERTIEIDGIRGYTEDGWFIIRASNTGPIIELRAESKSLDGLEKLKNFIKTELANFPQINLDWGRQYDAN
ncbi:MAG: Phosphoglucomutase/phosphomannomutase alpha/beta/alpha domain II [Candidatus Amesbacteria bacterium GW2011_GWA2_42_12]|uniref:Phosphoglucomutase/phosphomannomutase alpha/beta/alpha domain II n=1 Tax=Candidatus Amesbacteria bacterium GW2011_GWA2_42_12 TaxID=1618356 RepID=A0A0G0Y4R3_9BACT|nr:MAG: Phosphoglucomutase/phosphomannomutase alpha/beta/alpha domain II [Candidatus Amesbacteria bacterium GW2011_GWA2_42_12]